MFLSGADRRIRPFKEGADGQLVIWQEESRITLASEYLKRTRSEMGIVSTQQGLTIGNLAHNHIHPDSLRYPDSEPSIALDQS